MTTVIKIENLSKMYQLGTFSTGTLRKDIERWWAMVRGKEDPFIKIGEINDRSVKGKSDVVWSLRDINFEIKKGEAVGIIGKNGAGKSTLLKILSRVTSPTTGKLKVKGRVASLLEVGTGFHPELTGRENVFLNGAILGMRKKEILHKFDEIVDFSGIERFIDTPVKRYSSGMYVRLAFAVAAHLESEILIVDEVLAVGDSEFQKKCFNKMNEVSQGEGRTILFVSHNMSAVKQLCNNGILLKNGEIVKMGQSDKVIEFYLQDARISRNKECYFNNKGNKDIFLKYACCKSMNGHEKYDFNADEEIKICFEFVKESTLRGVYGHIVIKDTNDIIYIETDTLEQSENKLDTSFTGALKSELTIPSRILKTGTYFVSLGLASNQYDKYHIETLESFLSFEVIAEKSQRDLIRKALTSTILDWKIHNDV